MKKAQYRIENGNVYEYDHDSNAYIFYAKTYALTKEELKEIKRNTWIFKEADLSAGRGVEQFNKGVKNGYDTEI